MRRSDVLVNDGLITAVGPDSALDRPPGPSMPQAGCCVRASSIFTRTRRCGRSTTTARSQDRSGFTTELICPDGLRPAPLTDATVDTRRRYLRGLEPSTGAGWDWRSMQSYLDALQVTRPSANMISCVPHSAVRESVMGTPTARRIGARCRP